MNSNLYFSQQIGRAMRCPASKFITHTFSHICFLVLLAAATFRLDDKTYPMAYNLTSDLFVYHRESQQPPAQQLYGQLEKLNSLNSHERSILYNEKVDSVLKATFRPANVLMTNVQICLMFWIFGKLIYLSIYLWIRSTSFTNCLKSCNNIRLQ